MINKIIISTPKQILQNAIENACGLNEYATTINDLHQVDVSKDLNYRKNFVSYYRVRRDQRWLDEYFSFFESIKESKNISFGNIIRHISNVPHSVKGGTACTVEVSFASKMLTTISPDYPIWDSQVVRALGINSIFSASCTNKEKIEYYITAYAELKSKVDSFLTTEDAQKCMAEFDIIFPNYQWVSKAKKIDFYLWNIGKV